MTVQARYVVGASLLILIGLSGYAAQLYLRPDPKSERLTSWREGGLWGKRRNDKPRDESSPAAEALKSLPYLSGVNPKHLQSGVVRYDRNAVSDGYTLYCSGHAPAAILMDMEGRQLHQYSLDRADVWPEFARLDAETERRERQEWVERNFRNLHLFENGDLLAIYDDTGIVRMDVCGNVIWARRYNSHHDLDIDGNGRLYVLGKDFDKLGRPREEMVGHPVQERTIDGQLLLDEFIDIMTLSGEFLDHISLVECFENSAADLRQYLARSTKTMRASASPEKRVNPLHSNSLQILDGNHAHLSPAFQQGNILISFRNISLIAIIDPGLKRIVWSHRGPFRVQHDARFTAAGTVLLFNNFLAPEQSQVLELDPVSKRAVWEYSATSGAAFYSQFQGASRRLPNGNTLIVESCQGRAFEVTAEKRIVWDYRSPHTIGSDDELVAVVPDALRISPAMGESVLHAARACEQQP